MQNSIFSNIVLLIVIAFLISCKQQKDGVHSQPTNTKQHPIEFAKGFTVEKISNGITVVNITSPWPNADVAYRYALIPREKLANITINREEYDAIVSVPVEKIVVTATTHIPALEALGVENKLIGFPDTKYISSKKTRNRIDNGFIKELGKNETINTEMVLELNPELVVGFSINSQNKSYETIQRSNIPLVYNGDWTEESPLGKAEWIKFFAPFFNKESVADSIFVSIKKDYYKAKELATTASRKPTVMSGAMFKDVWYLPGGKSWAARFINDANADYLWKNSKETGSLALSWESVLAEGKTASFWIGPGQFVSYNQMADASPHNQQFDAFKNKSIYTFSNTKGATGGLLYYELAPHRPDLVLKDLIHIFHPELLPNHQSVFFKPLE